MSHFEEIKSYWSKRVAETSKFPWMIALSEGKVDICHYKGFLLETYHNAGLNPQLQAFASIFIPGNPRSLVKKFLQHAISEIAHDVLALNDLIALGESEKEIVSSKPLPMTQAFYANTAWGIQKFGHLYYLGYLFHLEFMPTQNGKKYIEMLISKGIPENAVSFLEEHSTVDIAHNKLMEVYISELIKTPSDLEVVKESIRCSVDLHCKVLGDAFLNGELRFSKKAA